MGGFRYSFATTLMFMRLDQHTEPVCAALGNAIEECCVHIRSIEQLEPEELRDSALDEELAIIEALLGSAFVVCQAAIVKVAADAEHIRDLVRRDHGICLKTIGETRKSILKAQAANVPGTQYSTIEAIAAFANYFKHTDEWRSFWAQSTGQQKQTVEVIMALGATQGSSGNLRTGAEALGNPEYTNVSAFVEIVSAWRTGLADAIAVELRCHGLG